MVLTMWCLFLLLALTLLSYALHVIYLAASGGSDDIPDDRGARRDRRGGDGV